FEGSSLTINDKIKDWNVSTITDMSGMFYYSTLNYDLGNWDVSNVTDMTAMFANTALSTENYDATLMGWSSLPSLQNGVVFDAGKSLYCLGENARQELIDDYGWTITDQGLNCFFGQLSVVEFVLVNADTEEDLFTITDGMRIDMRYLPTLNLDIRAETGTKTESVAFDLIGAQSIKRAESLPPYALFQDLPIGDYIGHEFAVGRYFLSGTPFSQDGLQGETGDALNITFEFFDSTLTVEGFTLMDASTDSPLFDLSDDLYFTLDDIPSLFLDIRANTSDDVESVRLELTGEQNTARTESLEPYALFQDLPIGDYKGNNFALGSYTVTATPYSGDNLTGEMGTPVSIDFRILDSNPILEVTGFTLIDPVTDTPLFDLTDDMVISLADIPSTFLAIRANTNDNVNSVRLELRGTQQTTYFDDIEPYTLPSDVPIGDYNGRNFSLGTFTITGIPHLGNDQDSS
ncbi:MAG: BspA family leucine-rich repeat surface protein, partial [Pricia sp.]|nr:BspA family leucine-rich repeat surface protein [Pricia sp.]